ncbi:MAG TPA: hypothetical protein DEP07_20825 [Brevibacillus sp.]|nr:hypothetical protein EDM60_23230 [Brevibacillus parabrevis]HBZ82802.1 hypothetical protein [Brevibacillus sp.]
MLMILIFSTGECSSFALINTEFSPAS